MTFPRSNAGPAAADSETRSPGPLNGIRVVEFAGIGPAPMTAMLLADLGADVIRIDRLQPSGLGIAKPKQFDFLPRGRQSIAHDLKHLDGVSCALDIVAAADGLIEGFRPGMMERIGLGPEACFVVNPRLVFGRVTGWGQSGPLASAAGHDLNYIALSGALHAIGRVGAAPSRRSISLVISAAVDCISLSEWSAHCSSVSVQVAVRWSTRP